MTFEWFHWDFMRQVLLCMQHMLAEEVSPRSVSAQAVVM